MRYGLISDIHGNLEALQAVYQEIDRLGVDDVLCLGDIIGYGPDPEKCIELVRDRASVILAGNHDHAPIGLVNVTYFNTYAKQAVEWTAAKISKEAREFLEGCPLIHEYERFTIVHSTPSNPSAWEYILSIDDAVENFPFINTRCCFIGHSHVPVIISKTADEQIQVQRLSRFVFQEQCKYIVNIGSVGQPRDLDPRAAFAIFDDETFQYDLHRVKYDIGKVQRKILDRGLPPFLAERLALGQ